MLTVKFDHGNLRLRSTQSTAVIFQRHRVRKSTAHCGTCCQQNPSQQQKLLTQKNHCISATAQQLAFLACQSNGLAHLFEETAHAKLLDLTQADSAHTADSSPSTPAAQSLESLLQQQLRAARNAEQQRLVEEIIYIWTLHNLSRGSMSLTLSIDAQQDNSCQQGNPVSQLMLTTVMSQAAADALVGIVASTFESSEKSSGNLRAHIDRTQAARLYAGNIEYGYFVREMEARCQEAGVAAGQNADQLIAFAASLSEEDLRVASKVRTRQAWHAAVRHTGLLFHLPTPPSPPAAPASVPATPALSGMDPPGSSGGGEPDCAGGSEGGDGASCLEAAADLPYPQLAQTVSSASFAPAAHLAEHYSPPGAAEEAARSAASKQARGWQSSEPQPQEFLPEPDLVAFQLATLKQLLLEAAAFGCMLWESEKAVQDSGYPLTDVQAAVHSMT
ncbi:hypothetical protein ABBQ38_002966 [Trebouxia sp. C0009 RCD-2024]